MKRLTERDEFGNADIVGVDSADLQENLNFDEMNLVTEALNKLACYEEHNDFDAYIKGDCIKSESLCDAHSRDFLVTTLSRKNIPHEEILPQGYVTISDIRTSATNFWINCRDSNCKEDYLIKDMKLSEFIIAYSGINSDFQSSE